MKASFLRECVRQVLALSACLLGLRTASAASNKNGAPTVDVVVVEVAGEHAYVQPGAAGGVFRGSRVVLDSRVYTVVGSTADFAVIEVQFGRVRERARGVATVGEGGGDDKPKSLPPVAPYESFRGIWPGWHPPADMQHPRPVPLGIPDRSRKFDIAAGFSLGGVVPLDRHSSGFSRTEIDARMHVEPLARPLALDLDASVQRWFGPGFSSREGDGARPVVRVRELQLGYGTPSTWFGAIGRMKYAAATLGGLDGLRVRAPLGRGSSVSAFGGLLPDSIDGSPSTDAQRFGLEYGFSFPAAPLRPEGAVVLHGSTFHGQLDERRVSGIVGVFPGHSRAGAHVEASVFDKDNPWNLAPVELTAAGLDGSLRKGVFQLGARVDMRQQERSLWMQSLFSSAWFCVPRPVSNPAAGSSAAQDACGDARANTLYLAGADASVTTERFSLTIAGTGMRNPWRANAPRQIGGFINARILKILRRWRAEGSVTASSGTYARLYSWSLGPGLSALGERLDASIYYRESFLTYPAAGSSLTQHGVGVSATVLPGSDVVFSLQGEAQVGDDVNALTLFFTTLWRPRW